jgi:uncharacterized protein involved in response to NO
MVWMQPLLTLSGLIWAGCFGIYLLLSWTVLSGPRTDGQTGCAEPLRQGNTAHGGCG